MKVLEYCDVDRAIKILKKIKKKNKKQGIIISSIDFDDDTEVRKITSPDYGCNLIKDAKTIVYNNDNYIPHMELYSILQDINNIKRSGVMHDIILCNYYR